MNYHEYKNRINEEYPETWEHLNHIKENFGIDFFTILSKFDDKFTIFLNDFYRFCIKDGNDEYFNIYRDCLFNFFLENKDKHDYWIQRIELEFL